MPVQPVSTTTIRSQLDHALEDGALTKAEASDLVNQLKQDGVSRYEANEVVEALRGLIGRSEVSPAGEGREALAAVFGALKDASMVEDT